ncbi:MAG: AsmA family protein [Woeseia sp.]
MSRFIKFLLYTVAAIIAIGVIAAIAFRLFFDPNDFRDNISEAVQDATGRELVIEGDLSVSIFPWLAVEMGSTTLGNAEGFGPEPFARFDSARLSVRLLPLILRREIAVGTASLDALVLNLAVNGNGVTNWDDLAAAGDAAPAETAPDEASTAVFDIAGVEVSNATIRYQDDAAGSTYVLEQMALTTGRIAFGETFDIRSNFDFTAMPGDMSGHVAFETRANISEGASAATLEDLVLTGTINGIATQPTDIRFAAPRIEADLDNSRATVGELELSALGLEINAAVEPFSWAGEIRIPATVEVSEFSLKQLLGLLDIEPPATADENALQRVSFSAASVITPESLALSDMTLRLDDTTMNGELSLPLAGDAPIRFDLEADSINLDAYMAPADESAVAADTEVTDDFEIPVDTIRGLEAQGALRVQQATFADMTFTNVELGLTSSGGKMRLNPLSAKLFDGTYQGDVRIDASGSEPVLSVDERVDGVSLTPLAVAMFEQEHLSGTIKGNFALNARGQTLSEMRSRLNGTMAFELADGAWEGTDIWYQLRRARALYRQEVPPEPTTPPRTEFSSVVASGTVTDGVFANNDLLAELPFMQLTGNGTVDLVEGEVDYAMQARVLERPEFVRGATEDELDEFTEAMIPVRIRGPFTDLSVRPDIEAMFRSEVEGALEKKGDELKQRLLDRLRPRESSPAAEDDPAAGEQPPAEEESVEDQLKNKLRNLLEQ